MGASTSKTEDPLMNLAKSLSSEALANWIQGKHQEFEQHKAEYILRSWAWYFLIPLSMFLLFAPGLLISVPSVQDCNDGVTKPWAPGTINIYNSLVAIFVFYLIILLIVFGLGGYWGIDPPFQKDILSRFASSITK
jgi:hypothetical protein